MRRRRWRDYPGFGFFAFAVIMDSLLAVFNIWLSFNGGVWWIGLPCAAIILGLIAWLVRLRMRFMATMDDLDRRRENLYREIGWC